MKKIIGPFRQVVPMTGIPLKGPLKTEHLSILEDACVCVEDGKVLAVADKATLENAHPGAEHDVMDGDGVLLPGFIDVHTHICWAGNRASDFAMRLDGKSYLEIAEAGGGIWSSVKHTRAASTEDLTDLILQRARHHLENGITTIEVKSGYGLGVDAEIRMLEAIRRAAEASRATLVPTCLAAHMRPGDFTGSNREYLQLLIQELLPKVRSANLTNRMDIFVERSAFSVEEASFYLEAASSAGFSLTVHGDQFSSGGSSVAIDCGAVSVDHLEASSEEDIRALAASSTIGVALPGASIGLGMAFTPARQLLDNGGCLAIASDWNPGSAPMGELLVQACILGVFEKLSMAEILAGMTTRAAAALELNDRGSLHNGQLADMQRYPVNDFREIIYNQGRIRPDKVWASGKRVFDLHEKTAS